MWQNVCLYTVFAILVRYTEELQGKQSKRQHIDSLHGGWAVNLQWYFSKQIRYTSNLLSAFLHKATKYAAGMH